LIGKKLSEEFKREILNLFKIWRKWKSLETCFIEGLRIVFLNKKKKSDKSELPLDIKKELEEYEDDLIDVYSASPQDLRTVAKKYGIIHNDDPYKVLCRVLSFKEYIIRKKYKNVIYFFTL
jgi:hypothetical protein